MNQNTTMDPYSPLWAAFWAANPGLHRSVGAAAAEEGAEGGEAAAGGDGAAAKAGDGAGDGGEAAKGDAATREGAPIGDGAGKDAGKDEGAKAIPEDWRADLPDDLRKVADRFTSKADAIRAIADFRKRESQARVPGKNASEEEVAAYRKAVGIPDKPEGYEFPTQEGVEVTPEVEAERSEWAQLFHEEGLSTRQVKAVLDRLQVKQEQAMEAQIEADKAYAKEQEALLRAEWKGEEYDKNDTLANRAFTEILNKFGVSVERMTRIETKDGRFIMDDPDFKRVFAGLGREMAEGTLGPSLNEGERETVENEIEDVRRQISEAQAAGDSKKANRLYEREQKLIAKVAGNRPVVGSQGRAA